MYDEPSPAERLSGSFINATVGRYFPGLLPPVNCNVNNEPPHRLPGGTLTGNLLEGDLNTLQSPPEEKYAKPIDLVEFIEADASRRLFPTLRIY